MRNLVYLCVSPRKSSLNIGICSLLELKCYGIFEVPNIIEHVSYRLAFPTNTRVDNVYHVYFLKKYVHGPNNVIDWNAI